MGVVPKQTANNPVPVECSEKIVGLQNNTQKIGDDLREFVSVRFNDLFKEIDKKFTDEGERLVSICYQLNLLRDNITFYHNAYLNKEILLLNNNLKQELLWTKMTHMDHLLYLFELKENIKTKFTVNKKEYEHIINSYLAEIDNEINSTFIDITKSDIKKEDDDETITVKTLVENAKISLEGSANK